MRSKSGPTPGAYKAPTGVPTLEEVVQAFDVWREPGDRDAKVLAVSKALLVKSLRFVKVFVDEDVVYDVSKPPPPVVLKAEIRQVLRPEAVPSLLRLLFRKNPIDLTTPELTVMQHRLDTHVITLHDKVSRADVPKYVQEVLFGGREDFLVSAFSVPTVLVEATDLGPIMKPGPRKTVRALYSAAPGSVQRPTMFDFMLLAQSGKLLEQNVSRLNQAVEYYFSGGAHREMVERLFGGFDKALHALIQPDFTPNVKSIKDAIRWCRDSIALKASEDKVKPFNAAISAVLGETIDFHAHCVAAVDLLTSEEKIVELVNHPQTLNEGLLAVSSVRSRTCVFDANTLKPVHLFDFLESDLGQRRLTSAIFAYARDPEKAAARFNYGTLANKVEPKLLSKKARVYTIMSPEASVATRPAALFRHIYDVRGPSRSRSTLCYGGYSDLFDVGDSPKLWVAGDDMLAVAKKPDGSFAMAALDLSGAEYTMFPWNQAIVAHMSRLMAKRVLKARRHLVTSKGGEEPPLYENGPMKISFEKWVDASPAIIELARFRIRVAIPGGPSLRTTTQAATGCIDVQDTYSYLLTAIAEYARTLGVFTNQDVIDGLPGLMSVMKRFGLSVKPAGSEFLGMLPAFEGDALFMQLRDRSVGNLALLSKPKLAPEILKARAEAARIFAASNNDADVQFRALIQPQLENLSQVETDSATMEALTGTAIEAYHVSDGVCRAIIGLSEATLKTDKVVIPVGKAGEGDQLGAEGAAADTIMPMIKTLAQKAGGKKPKPKEAKVKADLSQEYVAKTQSSHQSRRKKKGKGARSDGTEFARFFAEDEELG